MSVVVEIGPTSRRYYQRFFRGVWVLPVLLGASCGAEDLGTEDIDDLGQQEAPIVNGRLDGEHLAVGEVVSQGRLCTGTLIGRQTVLTAKHCLRPGVVTRFIVATPGGQRRVYWGTPALYPGSNLVSDIGLVRLSRPVSEVAPRQLCNFSPRPGHSITIVGYGRANPQGGAGVRRSGENQILRTEQTRFRAVGLGGSRAQTCFGDSGGPALVGQCVVGVASKTVRPYCVREMIHARVDVVRDWVQKNAGDPSIAWGDGGLAPTPTSSPMRRGGQVPQSNCRAVRGGLVCT